MTDKTAWEGHTPLPWGLDISGRSIEIWGGDEQYVCEVTKGEGSDADAALIVHCVNNFPALEAERDALREALEEFSREYDGFEDGDGFPCPTLAKARKALAISEKSE